MGAWGHNTFENDAALDWVVALADNQELSFLRESLDDGVDEDVLAAARDAVSKVRNDSELKELWEESTWLESWRESVDDLLRRLEP